MLKLNRLSKLIFQRCQKQLAYKRMISTDESNLVSVFTNTYQGHSLSGLNHELSQIVNQRQPIRNFYQCIDKIHKMGLKPDIITINLILKGLIAVKDFNMALNVVDDALRLGLKLDTESLNYLIEIGLKSGIKCEIVKQISQKLELPFNEHSNELFILGHYYRKEYEQLFLLFERLKQKRSPVNSASYYAVTMAYIRVQDFSKAFEIVKGESKRLDWIFTLDNLKTLSLVNEFAQACHLEGTLYLFQKIIEKGSIPDEGTCNSVLSVAARHGNPSLTTLCLQALSNLKANIVEEQFILILESYIKGGETKNWDKALYIMDIMHQSGLDIDYQLLSPGLKEHLKTHLYLSGQFYEFLNSKKCHHITIYHLLLSVYSEIGDWNRVKDIYDIILYNPKLKESILTFNLMLSGLKSMKFSHLKNDILEEMKARNIIYDASTYGHLIELSLIPTSSDQGYEEAFEYLENMKAAGYIPPYHIYAEIIKTCARNRDPRAYIALEEMNNAGYSPPPSLRRFIETGGVAV